MYFELSSALRELCGDLAPKQLLAWRFFDSMDLPPRMVYVDRLQREGHLKLFTCDCECVSVPIADFNNMETIENALYRVCAITFLKGGILHLHCSFVLFQDKALLFTGPSGIGKTTQAELWRDYQGALIVNGDAALLRRMEEGWWAFGTPVHGSSPYCENRQAPMVGLVALEQGPENRLTRLDDFQALTSCLPEFYRPQMDRETEEVFWNSVDSLFREVPVYRLTCRPDREATELVKRELFK